MLSMMPIADVLGVAALLCAAAASPPRGDTGVVCSAPIPHSTRCYGGEGALSTHAWEGMPECCAACANLSEPVACATWVQKSGKCMLLSAKNAPKSNTDCLSGTSLPPPPAPAGDDPLNPKLPPNRWGPYIGREASVAPEYGFISGFMTGCSWGAVEPVQGQFNFSTCDAVVRSAIAEDKLLSISAATGSAAPLHWLAGAGVPTVRVCFKEKNCTAPNADHEYPYYLAPAYFPLWRQYQQALHDWLQQLPLTKQGVRPVESVEVQLGSTGDVTPWHGTPLESKYHIDGDVWKDFWVNGSRAMWEIHRDLLPDTRLIFNGVPTNSTPSDDPDDKYWPAYHDLIFHEIRPPNFDMKQGVVSHEYMTSFELDDWTVKGNITRFPHFNATTGLTEFVRTRGESSDGGISPKRGPVGGPGIGFWMNPTWNLLAMMCWDITYGLDMQNPNPAMWSEEDGMRNCPPPPAKCFNWTKTLWRPFQHFHTHAGAKIVAEAPGGWLQLRDALDYSDVARFPVATFGGPVARNNTDRLKNIVEAHSGMGAVVEDIASASASRHASRGRRGINNAGWRIWSQNYGKWMTQLDAQQTSAGRWGLGSRTNLLGQSARQTLPGHNMSFRLAAGLFASHHYAATAVPPPAALHVRVAFFDEGSGQWELHYASANASGQMKLAARVQKNNTLEFVEVRLALTDLVNSDADEVHLMLVDSDATPTRAGGGWASSDPDSFAWIEVLTSPFLFPVAEVVHDLGGVVR